MSTAQAYLETATFHVAVLLTCHNRRAITIRCLESLFSCTRPDGLELDVILVDDGSVDGTADAVRDRFPSVRVLVGDGSLYWGGGTRRAMQEAREMEADAHVWLNDDAELASSALVDLWVTYRTLASTHGERTVVVGSMKDPVTSATSYGGVVQSSRWHPLKFVRLDPTDEPRECTTMNGNLVWIPRSVVEAIGVLPSEYVHAIGDFGYGLEARRAGARIWICPGHQGTCSRNDPSGSWEDPSLPLTKRLRLLRSAKGLPPRAYARLCRLAGARPWPVFVALPYLRVAWTSFKAALAGIESSVGPTRD